LTLAGRLRNLCVSRLSRHNISSEVVCDLETALDDSDDITLWHDGDEIAIGSSMCKKDGRY
jgi:hypothetical protein